MAKALVIVESPAKAKTINKYLGKDFIVKSSIGHVRDLPVSGGVKEDKESTKPASKTRATPEEKAAKARNALVARMGVDPEHNWAAHYEILPGKEKVVAELRAIAAGVDTIYLATDLDREGEAIAWHLQQVIGGDANRYQRVVFNEITRTAITSAFQHPTLLNLDRVNAQQARRFLDRVVGYMVSPLLWEKVARGLSAGRVQSVAVRLVVEKEREIRAFVPEEFWDLDAETQTAKKDNLRLQVTRYQDQAFKPKNEKDTLAAVKSLENAQYVVSKREDKPTKTKPPAPFITSTLQQAASTRLGFSVKKTMIVAQRLYEAGHITYMRTDSTNLSQDAVQAAREFIEQQFGQKYLLDKPNVYSSKSGAQEAHEAIRPSDVNVLATSLGGLERDAERLYDLIWRQFVACQMPEAEYVSTSLVASAADYELRTRGRILTFDGFTKVLSPVQKDNDDVVLPNVKVGEALSLLKLIPSQHFTKATPRYTEATLVRELEKRGIGRPSTYASIISTIQDRGYVKLDSKRFYAEKMGDIVAERLLESFDNLMDYAFTAKLEEELDKVAEGQVNWKVLLDDFYHDFSGKLKQASGEDGMRRNLPVAIDLPCVLCSRPMQIRTASTGVFLGCSGYALPPKERCKGTINLMPVEHLALADNDEDGETAELRAKKRCTKCGTAMDSYLVDTERKLHVCGNNPDCDGYLLEHGVYKLKGYEGPVVECDKCGGKMELKSGRFGQYFACSTCPNTRKVLKSGEPAPPKADAITTEIRCAKSDDHFVLRDGAAGLFLAASQFPKHRETRTPSIAELHTVGDRLDPKFHYLLQAPATDDYGNPSLLRFSRKAKEQFVATEDAEGKPTGWQAFYREGHWKITKGKMSK